MRMFLILLLVLVSSPAVMADEYPDVKSLVAAIQARLKTVNDYAMTIHASSPERGEVVLDYACVRPSDIRTEIVAGSHRGAVVVYVPHVKEKMVKVKSGNKRAWRNIDKLKLGGTPMVVSVLDRFGTDITDYSFTMKAHQKISIDVDRPVKTTASHTDDDLLGDDPGQPDVPGGTQHRVDHDCYVLDGTKAGSRLQLAIDSSTLWPVAIKRWQDGKLEFNAEIWRLTINTSPKIDF